MKVVFEYNPDNGEIRDTKGLGIYMIGMTPFESDLKPAMVLDLIKQGVTADEIIKLKNNGLL